MELKINVSGLSAVILILLLGCRNPVANVNPNGGNGDGINWNEIDIPNPGGIDIDSEYQGRILTIDPGITYQEIVGFGAADAWTGAFVGAFWDDATKTQMADWLFSQEHDEKGQVKGIGISKWRVNLGAGSHEQGRDSKILVRDGVYPQLEDPGGVFRWEFTRRGESYLADVNNPYNATSNPLLGGPLAISATSQIWQSPISDIVYDWNKGSGHQFWMREAKKRGTEIFVAASFSPVVAWTISGTGNNVQPGSSLIPGTWTYPHGGWTGNLTEQGYTSFANYVADVAEHFAQQTVTGPDNLPRNLRLDYISPVNEPQFDWNQDAQEGSSFSNANIARLSRSIHDAIVDPSRPNINSGNTKILIPEAASWLEAYSNQGGLASDQINAFFNPAQSTYVGNLESMAPVIAGHTYWTHETDVSMMLHREALRSRTREFNIEAWNTEWCGLGFGEDYPWGQHNAAPPWYVALFMAKLIHTDLTVAELTSWSFWTSIDIEHSFKNHASLIGVSPGTQIYDPFAHSTAEHDLRIPGTIKSQATLWTLGAYSLFIRPGFTRIDVTSKNFDDGRNNPTATDINSLNSLNNLKGLMASAYVSPPGFVDAFGSPVDRIVVVYVNWMESARPIAVEFADDRKPTLIRCYVSNENNTNSNNEGLNDGRSGMRRLAHENAVVTIPPRSVVTVVYDF